MYASACGPVRTFFTAFASLLVWCLCSKAFAGVTPKYYEAMVPVKNQSAAERKKAAKAGLAQVVVRVSGDKHLNTSTQSLSVDKAWSYVQRFSYDVLEDVTLLEQGFKRNLQLNFDPTVIRNLLKDMNANFWPTSRPNTLVWLVEDTVNNRKLVNAEDAESDLFKGIKSAALNRGLPLIYPILDLEDQNNVTADDVWALNEAAIREASVRYQTDVIFVGRLSTTSSGQMRATWQFFHAGQSKFYDSQSANYMEVGKMALNPLADFLAGRYAISAFQPQQALPGIALWVSNVNSFADYRGLLDYLESQPAFTDVIVEEVSDNLLKLRMQAQVQVNRIENTLSLNNSLIAEPVSLDSNLPQWQQPSLGSVAAPLRYRWSN